MVEHDIIWKHCLELIQSNLPSETFTTWFTPIKPINLENDTLTLEFPSQMSYEFVETHHFDLLKNCLDKVLRTDSKIHYQIPDQVSTINQNKSTNESPKSQATISNISERYTFDTFVEGSSNQYAKAASLAVAEAPGKTRFNPLVIYGKSGLGKTHLLHAIGNLALETHKVRNVTYLSSETFTNEFIKAIQKGKVTDFSSVYRNVDLLLLDDIQFFVGKERTQIEFFHTFNALHQSGKQIVLTSDRPPNELKALEERLISRFQWGLVTDIQPPDIETRIAILQKKAEQDKITVPFDVLQYIASNITANIRELEGSLIKLIAHSSFTNKPISIDLAKQVIGAPIPQKHIQISIELLQEVVSEELGITTNLLKEKTRKQEVVYARQVAMYLSKELTNHSLKTIGLHFGGRDHSTVIHAVSSVEKLLETDPNTKSLVQGIIEKVSGNA
ncbi:MAG: chromosomal replication initiator protein DnaA [Calditrichaeota bacterium]|nr:MAG: chromosomal replication initiator protein DnaA [Calditrichota bacterium]